MAENGVKISDNPTLASAEYLLALNEGSSGLFTIFDLGTLLAGGGVLVGTPTTDALSARITAVEDQAFAESPIYETTAEGIAATSVGDRFRVENADPDIAYDVYDHDTGGVATFITDILIPTLDSSSMCHHIITHVCLCQKFLVACLDCTCVRALVSELDFRVCLSVSVLDI